MFIPSVTTTTIKPYKGKAKNTDMCVEEEGQKVILRFFCTLGGSLRYEEIHQVTYHFRFKA